MEIISPINENDAKKLNAGDCVEIFGVIITARDAAHERIFRDGGLYNENREPISLNGQTIIYAGPCPARPGSAIGSFGPTTSARVDKYTELMLKLGVKAFIGKGERSAETARLCREYGAVYFLAIGGAAALYAKNVTACEIVAYEELGTESVKRLTAERLKVFVGIDINGNVLQDIEIPKYRAVKGL